jgi:hypothetical protein
MGDVKGAGPRPAAQRPFTSPLSTATFFDSVNDPEVTMPPSRTWSLHLNLALLADSRSGR